jgi:hypothetical protein
MIMEDGSVDPQNSLFLCSYSLLVLWVVLQVHSLAKSIARAHSLHFHAYPPICHCLNFAEALPETPRSINSYLLLYFLSMTLLSLQVSLAVLLDNFVASSARLEAEEAQLKIAEKKALRQFKNPLEPLVARQATTQQAP